MKATRKRGVRLQTQLLRKLQDGHVIIVVDWAVWRLLEEVEQRIEGSPSVV
jgi:hypothetical protein